MGVHARAVVAEQRLRHEGDALAGRAGDVLDHVLVGHDLVGHAGEGRVAQVDLALPARGHLVVVELARDPEPLEREHHARTQIVERVVRRGREVALLLAHRVAEPRLAGVPVPLGGVERVVRVIRPQVVRDLVENEELALGAEVGRVCDAALDQVLLGPPRHAARVAGVRQPRHGIGDLAEQRERRRLGEGVEDGRGRIGHEQHVRLRDLLPAPDRGAVEAETLVERRLGERRHRQGHVLPRPEQVAELQVDHLRAGPARPLDRVPRLGCGLAPVCQVLGALDLRHRSSSSWSTKKAPGRQIRPEAPMPPAPACSGRNLLRT